MTNRGVIRKHGYSRAIAGAIALLLTAAVAACGSPPKSASDKSYDKASGSIDQLASAAKKEGGTLVWYSAVDTATNDALIADFTKRYGIKVEVTRLATGPLLEKVASEKSSGANLVDVIETASPTPYKDDADWFSPLDQLPGYKEYPKGFKDGNNVATTISPWGITYNTDLVKPEDVPKKWEDLIDPKWAGKVLLTDVRSSPSWMAWAQRMEDAYGIDYLKKVAALKPDLTEAASAGAAQIAAGAQAINFPATPGNSQELRDQGAHIASVSFDKNTGGSNLYLGVSSSAPHPYAARLFAAYRMTADAAKAICGASETVVPMKQKGCLDLPSGYETPKYGLDEAQENKLSKALGLT